MHEQSVSSIFGSIRHSFTGMKIRILNFFISYSIGGYDGQSFLNSMESYDPATNQWTMLAPMACRRSKENDI